MTLKQRFLNEVGSFEGDPKVVVVAVQLPSGAIETIVNTELCWNKLEYYNKAYDENFQLKTNPEVKIVGFMIV